MATPDLSAPIATLLRTSTAEAHDNASKSEGAGWLTRGELDREGYVRYLMMLYHIYDGFERALEQHASHPVLQPTYNPTLLARTSSLASDIAYLLQVPEAQWQSHPVHVQLVSSPPSALTDYTARLQQLAASSSSTEEARLLAHAYVRYLGDLSGGQFVKRQLGKVYGLEDGYGLAFYDFKQLGGTASATIGDMKKIKEWYRDGMNTGVGDDAVIKAAVLDEANIAFDLNSGLLQELRAPTRTPASSTPAAAPLGDVSTPTGVSPAAPTEKLGLVEVESPAGASTYRISTVIALVAALSLSHFVLVLGGFTGTAGSAKLEAVQHWFAQTFASSSS